MSKVWTKKRTVLRLALLLVLIGVLGVVAIDTHPVSATSAEAVSAGGNHTCALTLRGSQVLGIQRLRSAGGWYDH